MSNKTSVNPGNSRATFGTRVGALAAAVGSAVGFGNIWRFPYMTGQNGGAAFLVIYVVSVLILGVPLLIAEFCIGRSAHRNVVGAFRKVAPGTHWYLVGILGLLVACLILGFYVVLSGWTLHATWQALTNTMNGDGFQAFVDGGQQITKGQKLLHFDRKAIKAAGHPDTVIVVITNGADFKNLKKGA